MQIRTVLGLTRMNRLYFCYNYMHFYYNTFSCGQRKFNQIIIEVNNKKIFLQVISIGLINYIFGISFYFRFPFALNHSRCYMDPKFYIEALLDIQQFRSNAEFPLFIKKTINFQKFPYDQKI